MLLLSCPIVLVALAAIIAIHVIAALAGSFASRILTYINIVLHLLILIPLVLYKFKIEEAVLVYMISVFAYTLINYIKYRIFEGKTEDVSKTGDEKSDTDESEEVADDV